MSAQTVTAAVAKREAGPVTIMMGRKKHFRAVLPASVDVDAFLGTAAGALYANSKLMEAATANPDSLIVAMMRCAALGHLPGTDEFYLLWRMIKDADGRKRPTVQGIEGYRGIIERMYRSGAVKNVVVREVCARDAFQYVEGEHDKPVHHVDWFGHGRGDMIGVYAYATLTTGAVSRVVILNRDDVMAAREASDAKDSSFSPWNRLDAGKDHPEFTGRSMWWKTAARRLEPWVPTSAEYRREQLRAAAAAAGVRAETPDYVPPANGHAEPDDIHDAEIVQPAETSSDDVAKHEPTPRAASATARRQLGYLTDQLHLEDTSVLFPWVLGEPYTETRAQAQQLITWLNDHLRAADGDSDAAAVAIWDQYRQAHPTEGEPE